MIKEWMAIALLCVGFALGWHYGGPFVLRWFRKRDKK